MAINFDPNNFTFEIESTSFQMVHSVLSTSTPLYDASTIATEHHVENDAELYLLARAYAELLLKAE